MKRPAKIILNALFWAVVILIGSAVLSGNERSSVALGLAIAGWFATHGLIVARDRRRTCC